MNLRTLHNKTAHIALLAAVGLIARLALARQAAVNGDTGLYIFDAMQILDGKTMMVDFPSRSPVFEHTLALAIWLGDSPILSARAMMIGISIGLGVAIYVLARQIFGHREGLAAAALFYLTPLPLVWGQWMKTEQAAALLAILGFVVALEHIDRDAIPGRAMVAIGIIFGLGLLTRLVSVVYIGAFALFVLWYRHRAGHSLGSTLAAAAGTVLTAASTILVAYLLIAGGDALLAARIADTHIISLFKSSGQAAIGWIDIPHPRTEYTESRGGIFFLCQKCGTNTAAVFGYTFMVTLPAVLAGFIAVRSLLRRFETTAADTVAPAVVAAPTLYFFLIRGITAENAALAVAAIGALYIWFTKPVNWTNYWRPEAMLPLAVFLSLAAGYLYRDRILYTSYFQDLFPFLAVLAGAAAVYWLRANQHTAVRVGMAAILLSSAVAGGVHAYPYSEVDESLESHWFTVDLVEAHGQDIDRRTEPGERIFTAQPLYVVQSDATLLFDLSRKYYLYRGWPDIALTDYYMERIRLALIDGSVPYAIYDTNMEEITAVSPPVGRALEKYYCEVDAPLYDRTNATLLAHQSTSECQ